MKQFAGSCAVCNIACKPKDIIQIESEGTGYAGKGKNIAKKENVAFHC